MALTKIISLSQNSVKKVLQIRRIAHRRFGIPVHVKCDVTDLDSVFRLHDDSKEKCCTVGFIFQLALQLASQKPFALALHAHNRSTVVVICCQMQGFSAFGL